jgi:cytoplasmic iron level regulating protein YaaA (DUF328/UPF0246 family)
MQRSAEELRDFIEKYLAKDHEILKTAETAKTAYDSTIKLRDEMFAIDKKIDHLSALIEQNTRLTERTLTSMQQVKESTSIFKEWQNSPSFKQFKTLSTLIVGALSVFVGVLYAIIQAVDHIKALFHK